ncbi:MAG: hypothetical protein U9R08_06085 [Nanoarchaeota archaeon]|nr:hypothetical protein [Nanoarchaeota archaeon]
MAKKFDYIDTLGESLKQLFSNGKIFIPIASFIFVNYFLNLLYIPSISSIFQGVFDFRFLIYIPIMFIVSVLFYSWFYIEIKNITDGKKIKTYKDFVKGLKKSWELIGLYILLFLILIGVALVLVLLLGFAFFALAINIIFGIILSIIIGILAILITFSFGSAAMYAPVIFFTDNLSIVKTLKRTYEFFMKKKGHCIIMFLIYLAVIMVSSVIGNMFIYLAVPATEVQFLMINDPLKYVTLSIPSMIIGATAFVWIYIFYFRTYKKFKK